MLKCKCTVLHTCTCKVHMYMCIYIIRATPVGAHVSEFLISILPLSREQYKTGGGTRYYSVFSVACICNYLHSYICNHNQD